ncbi:MAG TPA: hypothetical protein VIJ58_02180 [Candidatus Dormibacteraeota bacterium]
MKTTPKLPIPPGLLTPQGTPDPYQAFDPQIARGRNRLTSLTRASGALDPVTSELVRLRNAYLQGCNT